MVDRNVHRVLKLSPWVISRPVPSPPLSFLLFSPRAKAGFSDLLISSFDVLLSAFIVAAKIFARRLSLATSRTSLI